ncbi:MAG: hypothetical protein ACOCXT_06875 [Candidatus Dojkabacteria bacterium]
MRVVLTFKNSEYIKRIEREYIRNWIYNCLRGTKWMFYHDKPRYKHFSYSNLFPFDKAGAVYGDFKLIISSPYDGIPRTIEERATETTVKFGDYIFEVASVGILHAPAVIEAIETATPVMFRFFRTRLYDAEESGKRHYAFWNEGENLDMFVSMFHRNLQRRYQDFLMESSMIGEKLKGYTPVELGDDTLFSTYTYRKTIFGWDKHNLGTMWRFGIKPEYQQSPIVRYLYDAGAGERTASSGSGFMNIVKK